MHAILQFLLSLNTYILGNYYVKNETIDFNLLSDDHDLVLRFNHAPTDGYVEDVGMKTDIRIVNSKVASNPKFEFLSSPRFRNVTILVWDPCSYSSSLKEVS